MGHKKNKTKYYTFLLVPDDEKAARSIRFSASLIRFLIVLLVVISTGIIFGAASYWKVASLAVGYYNLLDENQKLKHSLEKVEEIKTDLAKIKNMDQKLRSSMSGYIKVMENSDEIVPENESTALLGYGSREIEKALFNSIPDILPVEGFITRGVDTNPFQNNLHLGIDIAAAKGSPVKATADGIVIFSGYTLDEGNVIILKHKNNIYSVYKHNLSNLCSEMEFVKKRQVIALLGSTGEISSGAHVHFEIWKNNIPVDPLQYIRGADQYLQ